jgi:predicted N-acetyltransferase YhbS
MRDGIARAGRCREPLIVLVGHPGYSPRFGFAPASLLGLLPPDDRTPEAAFMALRLPDYDPKFRGRIVYPDAFAIAEGLPPPVR